MTLFTSLTVSSAAVINLTNEMINGIAPSLINVNGTDYSAGVFNGAGGIRRTIDSDAAGSGSGVFRNLYTVGETGKKTGEEFGYNRDGVMGTHVSNGFEPIITVNDLVLDSTGNFFVFTLDTNETGSADKYISLDSFQIFVGGHIDDVATEPVANTKDELGNLGLKVYDIDNVEDNTVLMDASLFGGGSGTMDAYLFVPVSSFDGHDPNSLLYVFTEFGGYESEVPGFGFSAGNEHVAMPYKADVNPPVTTIILAVPEPHSVILLSLGGLVLAFCRRRA